MNKSTRETGTIVHGRLDLPDISVTSYNLEIKDEDGFVGDRASGRAFRAILDDVRARVAEVGEDPLGEAPSGDLRKRTLDEVLEKGEPEAAGVVQGAIETFAGELAGVTRRFLKQKAWRGIRRIVVGGGFAGARIGELAIGRASVLLKSDHVDAELVPLGLHPDEAGLIGCAHLAPPWIFEGFDAILAVDVGGSNIRCGIVELRRKKAPDLSKARVGGFDLWRHRDDKPTREHAIDRLGDMLGRLVAEAEKDGLRLAPFVGVGCPGVIDSDGTIERGAQNLPGRWDGPRFNLPAAIRERLPTIGAHETLVLVHNDAVVQGLSVVPRMAEEDRWAVLTIGTGLGNASFAKRTLPA
ncbi:ROK family protein [Segnochrobactrum spirostomi]|uniref:ROK family protein n=1 Tax=Segnochrobactrum spirostomi TaxID=2608987 RepID=A0A6A7XXP6_9HYPH|nr:ROK family protein [Segnochrobactrum spirostomi]MQT11088.1 ROK family protein [Segnochrobactrum spirostomi]